MRVTISAHHNKSNESNVNPFVYFGDSVKKYTYTLADDDGKQYVKQYDTLGEIIAALEGIFMYRVKIEKVKIEDIAFCTIQDQIDLDLLEKEGYCVVYL